MKRKPPRLWREASRYNLLRNRMIDESMPMQGRWLYAVLDSFNDKQGRALAKPPLSVILKRADMSRTSFYEWRTVLVERGWVKAVERIGKDGKALATEYHTVQDWTGIANRTVSHVPDSDSTPVRIPTPSDMACTTYYAEEKADDDNRTKEDPPFRALPAPPTAATA